MVSSNRKENYKTNVYGERDKENRNYCTELKDMSGKRVGTEGRGREGAGVEERCGGVVRGNRMDNERQLHRL